MPLALSEHPHESSHWVEFDPMPPAIKAMALEACSNWVSFLCRYLILYLLDMNHIHRGAPQTGALIWASLLGTKIRTERLALPIMGAHATCATKTAEFRLRWAATTSERWWNVTKIWYCCSRDCKNEKRKKNDCLSLALTWNNAAKAKRPKLSMIHA
jgi:hypothetical protein